MWISNRYQKGNMSLKEIGLCDQNMLTRLGSIVNITRWPIWPFNEHKNLHFDNEWDIHLISKNHEAITMGTIWICWLSHTNCGFLSYVKLEQREKYLKNTCRPVLKMTYGQPSHVYIKVNRIAYVVGKITSRQWLDQFEIWDSLLKHFPLRCRSGPLNLFRLNMVTLGCWFLKSECSSTLQNQSSLRTYTKW